MTRCRYGSWCSCALCQRDPPCASCPRIPLLSCSDVLRFLLRVRAWEYRQLPSLVRLTGPSRPDKARRLGYKAKQGYVVYRVRVRRGGRKKPVSKVGSGPCGRKQRMRQQGAVLHVFAGGSGTSSMGALGQPLGVTAGSAAGRRAAPAAGGRPSLQHCQPEQLGSCHKASVAGAFAAAQPSACSMQRGLTQLKHGTATCSADGTQLHDRHLRRPSATWLADDPCPCCRALCTASRCTRASRS